MGVLLLVVLTLGLSYIFYQSFQKITDKSGPVEVVATNAARIDAMIKHPPKFSTIFFLYTTDCEACATQMAQMKSLIDSDRLQSINFILVSLDDNTKNLGSFIRKYQFPAEVSTYYASPEARDEIFNMVKRVGGQRSGGVPYTMMFDKRGILVVEYPDVVQATDLDAVLQDLTARD